VFHAAPRVRSPLSSSSDVNPETEKSRGRQRCDTVWGGASRSRSSSRARLSITVHSEVTRSAEPACVLRAPDDAAASCTIPSTTCSRTIRSASSRSSGLICGPVTLKAPLSPPTPPGEDALIVVVSEHDDDRRRSRADRTGRSLRTTAVRCSRMIAPSRRSTLTLRGDSHAAERFSRVRSSRRRADPAAGAPRTGRRRGSRSRSPGHRCGRAPSRPAG
jgi:hypothetical protein